MLIVYIIYMLIILALLCINAIIEWRTVNGENVYRTINVKRITLPILTLMFLFLIVIAANIISQVYYVFSDGFVNNTAIFIGIVAVVYICDYFYFQYKLRNYDLIQFNVNYNKILINNKDILKIVSGKPYLLKNNFLKLNIDSSDINLGNHEYLCNKNSINDNVFYAPPEYPLKDNDENIAFTETNKIKYEKVTGEFDKISLNDIDKKINNNEKSNSVKSAFIVKKLLIFALFIACFVFGLLIQIVKINI